MEMKIVQVSLLERIRLQLLAYGYGFYLIIKRFIKWAWNPQGFFVLQQRDKPPACLIDNTFGKHSYVKLKGVKFHYVEAGDKENPLVILLHGFPDCWLSWREQILLLSKNFRVVALDLKGFGDSDKPLNKGSYKIETLIDELRHFCLALGSKPCSIIGHDLGGLLGWYLCALHNDLFTKFIAISSPHPNYYWDGISGDKILSYQWIHFSRLPFLPEIDALKEDLSIINDTFKHLKSKKETTRNCDYVEAYKYTFSRKEDWTGPINYYRTLPYTRLDMTNCRQIQTKCLLVVGNADPTVSLENIIQSTEYVEQFKVKVIPGARHFPHQEKPNLVNDVIIDFLIDQPPQEKVTPSKSIVSSWLDSISTTVKYGNHVIDAVQKTTNGVVNGFPTKVLYTGHINR